MHLERVAGRASWDQAGPRYVLPEAGRLVRERRFDDDRLARLVRMPHLFLSHIYRRFFIGRLARRDTDVDLYLAVVRAAHAASRTEFPGSRMHVIYWDVFRGSYIVRASGGFMISRVGLPALCVVLAMPWSDSVRADADQAGFRPAFSRVLHLEETSETSANVSLGDLDGDGDLDVVLAKGRHWPLRDRVLLNDGNGVFTPSDLGPIADRTYSAVLTDIDGDGDLDVVTSNDRPDRKLVFANDGTGRFSEVGTWGSPEWSTRNASAADLDGDGRPDLIAANRGGPSYVCLNDGRGRFDTRPCIPIPAESATSIAAGDFNNDGFVDLAVPARDGGQSRVYLNDGRAGFSSTVPFGPSSVTARIAAAADFNGDGWLDLVTCDETSKEARVYLNDGRGGFREGILVGDREHVPYALATADLNGDRRQDFVVGFVQAAHAAFINDGTGSGFTRVAFGDAEGAAYGFAVGDLDGDGLADIAMARSDATNVVYFGSKSPTEVRPAPTARGRSR